MSARPVRNLNPGDLRTLPTGQHWSGQKGTDNAPGGPFAIFGTAADGWGALATCLLAYQDLHGLHTVRSMIARFAPALENDTGGYISLVCNRLGVKPDDTINAHSFQVMDALCQAIGKAEGGTGWADAPRVAGVSAALARGLASARAVTPAAPMRPTGRVAAVDETDALNAAELARHT